MFRTCRNSIILALFVGACASSASAKGNDVSFFGTVLSVSMQSATQGAMVLRLMGSPVTVRLTGDTEIEAHGDEVGFDGLSVGDFVKVSGFFSNSAITARQIVVIDKGEGEFRLRGAITKTTASSDGTVITVLGIEVLVNSETKIDRRGRSRDLMLTDLAVGMLVDVRGHSIEGDFVAKRLKVGLREDDAIRVDFLGKITAVATGKLTLDTEGGSTAIVLITTGTTVIGTPAVGKFADVRGELNSSLEVVASRIIIKSNRDDDDDDDDDDGVRSNVEFKKEIPLRPVTDGAVIRGEAEIEIKVDNREVRQEFEVKIERGAPNTQYRIVVEIASSGGVDFGTITTNREGAAETDFRSRLSSLLPAGKTVRDFVSVQVLQGTVLVLRGTF